MRGIYEFTLPVAQCASCHTNSFPTSGTKPLPTGGVAGIDFTDAKLPEALGVCQPVLKVPRKMRAVGLRLALSVDGTRPEKFGGTGVIVFELVHPVDADRAIEEAAERDELAAKKQRVTEKLKAALLAEEKARLEAELKALNAHTEEMIAREAERKAQVELQRAQATLEVAKAQVLMAQTDVKRAEAGLQLAKARVVSAQNAVADLKKPQPQPEGAFTVHVRPLTEAEKVVRVKATGKETVLEGLAYATEVAPIKSSEVSVWVVRDKEVLPVDLPAITRGTDAKTNYTLKSGDQLFVQIKPGK